MCQRITREFGDVAAEERMMYGGSRHG